MLREQNPSCVSALKSLLLSNDDGDVNENGNKKIANMWRIERDGICAIKFQKFEAARIHLLSDVYRCCLSFLLFWRSTSRIFFLKA